jgi:hypothetical protein
LTPDPLTKYFKGLRINAYVNGSGLKGGVALSFIHLFLSPPLNLKGERNTLKRATLLSPLDIIYNIG